MNYWTWTGRKGIATVYEVSSLGENIVNPRAALAFADPPYNYSVPYANDATMDNLSLADWQRVMRFSLDSMRQLVIPGGSVWMLLPWDRVHLIDGEYEHLKRQPQVIWQERFGQYQQNKGLTVGHRHLLNWMETSAPRARWNPDDIRVQSVRQKMGDKRADPRGRVPDTVWAGPRLPGNARARVDWHPAQLSPAPLRTLVRGWSDRGDTVFELFSGSGSLAVVCIQEGREYVGVEQSPVYCENIMSRLVLEFGGKAERKEDGCLVQSFN